MGKKTLIHIVSYQQSEHLEKCLDSLGQIVDESTTVHLTDNASDETWFNAIRNKFPWLSTLRNKENLGFCGGHNQGAFLCISGNYDGILILNPDVELSQTTVQNLWAAVDETKADAATPLLVRSDNNNIVDAAGMYFTPATRHFDRFSGQVVPQRLKREFVAGGTGACLLLTQKFLKTVALTGTDYEDDLWKIYPQLATGQSSRLQIFDEAFFAYREDAELALRSQALGLKTIFVPEAVATHGRGLKPEERSNPVLNYLGVKNRFLLQMNILPLSWLFQLLWQTTIRNFVVIAGVFLKEQPSIKGLKEAWSLRRRALSRKKALFALSDKTTIVSLKKWFAESPYTEQP